MQNPKSFESLKTQLLEAHKQNLLQDVTFKEYPTARQLSITFHPQAPPYLPLELIAHIRHKYEPLDIRTQSHINDPAPNRTIVITKDTLATWNP